MGNFPLVGDVNHDGNLDLIGFGVIALGAGDGTFQQTITASVCFPPDSSMPVGGFSPGPSAFTVADFKHDGDLDFSFVDSEVLQGGFGFVSATATVCFGNGDGTFENGPTIYAGGGLAGGGLASDVPFAGLSATQVGVNELTVVVPAGVHGVAPLQFNAGAAANVTIAVQ